MRVEFSKKFSKDLDGLRIKSVKQNLRRIIELMESADSLDKNKSQEIKGSQKRMPSESRRLRNGFLFRKFYYSDRSLPASKRDL